MAGFQARAAWMAGDVLRHRHPQFCLSIKVLFGLPYGRPLGWVAGLLKMAGLERRDAGRHPGSCKGSCKEHRGAQGIGPGTTRQDERGGPARPWPALRLDAVASSPSGAVVLWSARAMSAARRVLGASGPAASPPAPAAYAAESRQPPVTSPTLPSPRCSAPAAWPRRPPRPRQPRPRPLGGGAVAGGSSTRSSPRSAQGGCYASFLFDAPLERLHLSLQQGTTALDREPARFYH